MITDETVMPFGKFKGYDVGKVPAGYLLWLAIKTLEKDASQRSQFDTQLAMYVHKNKTLLQSEKEKQWKKN